MVYWILSNHILRAIFALTALNYSRNAITKQVAKWRKLLLFIEIFQKPQLKGFVCITFVSFGVCT